EASGMRIKRRQGRGAGDVRDPRPLRNGTCDLGDRRVGDAQQHQVSPSAGRFAPGAHRQAAFLEPRGDRAAGPSRPHDSNAFDHRVESILRVVEALRLVGRTTIVLAVGAMAATIVTFALRVAGAEGVPIFIGSAVALAMLASLVGEATDQLGGRLGAGATGVLQSALGNLPELLISLFALQAGLVTVVQTALIGSILANTLLVLGLAFLFGGLRNGPQQFASDRPRMIAVLLLLATAALAIPALATAPGA